MSRKAAKRRAREREAKRLAIKAERKAKRRLDNKVATLQLDMPPIPKQFPIGSWVEVVESPYVDIGPGIVGEVDGYYSDIGVAVKITKSFEHIVNACWKRSVLTRTMFFTPHQIKPCQKRTNLEPTSAKPK